jgi:hypothetical protein
MKSLPPWLASEPALLDERCPLPLDRPFTSAEARPLGASRHTVHTLVERGLVREVVRGVYVAAQVPDTIECRLAALRLVLPADAVVTDRTASWLHGVDALPRSAVHVAPDLQVFSRADSRVRRPGVHSGIRMLGPDDVLTLDGVRVTTPLRTALDLGRLLPRYDAIAALDAFRAWGLELGEMEAQLDRFRGFRGVVQLRELVPLSDPRPESGAESALRLHWLDAGLSAPQPQFWVYDELGTAVYRIDLALPEVRYAAEFQGERFHLTDAQRDRDARRTAWLREHGWTVQEFWKDDLYAAGADPQRMLREGIALARAQVGAWRPQGRFLA